MDNKKTLILSVVGVLVLVLVVVGISYAMYTFAGTGTVENVITTGTISVSYPAETSNIKLVDVYPTTDAVGAAADNKCVGAEADTKTACEAASGTWQSTTLEFAVTATLSGSTRIDYEVAIDPVAGNTLADQYVKFNLQKDEGSGYTYKIGSVNSGALVSAYSGIAGTLTDTTITGGKIDGGTFRSTGTHNYILRAWVSDQYDLPTTDTSTGNTHSNETTSATYAFKIKTYATQITGA